MRLIDADELKNKIPEVSADIFENCGRCKLFDDVQIKDLINFMPTIEAEPIKHAHMLTDEDGNIECSNCGSGECWGNYCMSCGARMDEVEE